MQLTINIPGHPVAKGRARAFARQNGSIGHYTPAATRTWEGIARSVAIEQMQKAGMALLAGALRVDIEISIAVPASWPAWKREAALAGEIAPTTKPDRDNVEKAAKDALNGVVWLDDSYVVDGRTRKSYSPSPGVVVRVSTLEAQAAQTARKHTTRTAA